MCVYMCVCVYQLVAYLMAPAAVLPLPLPLLLLALLAPDTQSTAHARQISITGRCPPPSPPSPTAAQKCSPTVAAKVNDAAATCRMPPRHPQSAQSHRPHPIPGQQFVRQAVALVVLTATRFALPTYPAHIPHLPPHLLLTYPSQAPHLPRHTPQPEQLENVCNR